MPNYVVIARFDDDKTTQLMNLRNSLEKAGYLNAISEWPPHITIAAYEDINIDALLAWTEDFIKQHSVTPVALVSLNILPPGGEHNKTAVLCAAPSPTRAFTDFYYDFHLKLDEYCGNLGFFYTAKCDGPVFHSTIGVFEIAKIQKALETVFTSGILGVATVTALEVYTYPMKLIKRFELKQRQTKSKT